MNVLPVGLLAGLFLQALGCTAETTKDDDTDTRALDIADRDTAGNTCCELIKGVLTAPSGT